LTSKSSLSKIKGKKHRRFAFGINLKFGVMLAKRPSFCFAKLEGLVWFGGWSYKFGFNLAKRQVFCLQKT
jgi:hypothetical protein